jgi:hypothetical protein
MTTAEGLDALKSRIFIGGNYDQKLSKGRI